MHCVMINIDHKTPAFKDEPLTETVRILRAAADRLEAGDIEDQQLCDKNGNWVGRLIHRQIRETA